MKVCTYKRPSPTGLQKRLGVFVDEQTLIDVNLVWQAEFERQGFYDCITRAQLLAPSSLARFLRLYQDNSIAKLQETLAVY